MRNSVAQLLTPISWVGARNILELKIGTLGDVRGPTRMPLSWQILDIVFIGLQPDTRSPNTEGLPS